MGKIVQTAGRNTLGEFAPEFAHFNDDVLFGENWNNQDIDVKTRSIITVVALMASGITDSSLKYHLQNAKNHGVTQKEIAAVITHAAFYAGWPKAWAVFNLAKEVWEAGEGDLLYEEEAKADLFEIEPKVPYTKADLDWMNKKSRSSVEMSDKKYRPEIMKKKMDMSSYDEILLGFPIWWYVAPTIVNTFLEAYDFSGKKIVLFATSGGSGFGNTVKELQPSAPDAVITEGSLLNRGTKKEISEWVKSL